jgi:hypothetical protein
MTGKMLRIILTKSLPAQCSSLIFPSEESSLHRQMDLPQMGEITNDDVDAFPVHELA